MRFTTLSFIYSTSITALDHYFLKVNKQENVYQLTEDTSLLRSSGCNQRWYSQRNSQGLHDTRVENPSGQKHEEYGPGNCAVSKAWEFLCGFKRPCNSPGTLRSGMMPPTQKSTAARSKKTCVDFTAERWERAEADDQGRSGDRRKRWSRDSPL